MEHLDHSIGVRLAYRANQTERGLSARVGNVLSTLFPYINTQPYREIISGLKRAKNLPIFRKKSSVQILYNSIPIRLIAENTVPVKDSFDKGKRKRKGSTDKLTPRSRRTCDARPNPISVPGMRFHHI
jgi:hypothetical protein